jgi:hypothetical protein
MLIFPRHFDQFLQLLKLRECEIFLDFFLFVIVKEYGYITSEMAEAFPRLQKVNS